MMTLNFLAIAVATVAGMLVGWAWFSPALLGKPWAARAGIDLAAKTPGWAYLLALVATAITATVLALAAAIAHDQFGGSFLTVTLAVASIGWLGFTASRNAVEYLFEKKSPTLFAIDMGHQLAVLIVMSVVIGLFGHTSQIG
ncbi:DUF1761 domain-containing protein [Salinibacterium sp. NG22]|nr:DUF1761 domain-containing protein [Salinibacterium sp. NG22]